MRKYDCTVVSDGSFLRDCLNGHLWAIGSTIDLFQKHDGRIRFVFPGNTVRNFRENFSTKITDLSQVFELSENGDLRGVILWELISRSNFIYSREELSQVIGREVGEFEFENIKRILEYRDESNIGIDPRDLIVEVSGEELKDDSHSPDSRREIRRLLDVVIDENESSEVVVFSKDQDHLDHILRRDINIHSHKNPYLGYVSVMDHFSLIYTTRTLNDLRKIEEKGYLSNPNYLIVAKGLNLEGVEIQNLVVGAFTSQSRIRVPILDGVELIPLESFDENFFSLGSNYEHLFSFGAPMSAKFLPSSFGNSSLFFFRNQKYMAPEALNKKLSNILVGTAQFNPISYDQARIPLFSAAIGSKVIGELDPELNTQISELRRTVEESGIFYVN